MINTAVNGVARTLFLTLRARADEQLQSLPLFDDPWSVDWYQFAPRYSDYDQWYHPIFQLASAIRTKLIDEMVARFLAQHPQGLVVELGAGLSTRYYRLGSPQCEWIEVDLPESIAIRYKIDVESERHWFISGSLTQTDWLTQLTQGYCPDDVIFIMEGVAMFLQSDEMTQLLDMLRTQYAGAHLVLDVVREQERERLNESFSRLQSPVFWGADKAQLSAMGLDVRYTEYILQQAPQRWAELGIHEEKLTPERSGFVSETILTPIP